MNGHNDGHMVNTLYYGDNLQVLREHVGDESVDLVYLDPPFKSDQNYNVLFAERDGTSLKHRSKPLGTLGIGMKARPERIKK